MSFAIGLQTFLTKYSVSTINYHKNDNTPVALLLWLLSCVTINYRRNFSDNNRKSWECVFRSKGKIRTQKKEEKGITVLSYRMYLVVGANEHPLQGCQATPERIYNSIYYPVTRFNLLSPFCPCPIPLPSHNCLITSERSIEVLSVIDVFFLWSNLDWERMRKRKVVLGYIMVS